MSWLAVESARFLISCSFMSLLYLANFRCRFASKSFNRLDLCLRWAKEFAFWMFKSFVSSLIGAMVALPADSFGCSRLVMLPLWLSVFGATLAMFELDWAAGLAFLPYMIWVTVAAALNYRVAQLNPTVAPRDLSAD